MDRGPGGQKSKIRFYCGLCQIACKDQNGYKCHLETENHLHRELAVTESLRTFVLSSEDKSFRKKFLDHLVAKHFGQTCLAHEVYRDLYPLDRGHNIIKATCWGTLGVFIAQLRKDKMAEANKGVKGWQVRVSSIVDEEEEQTARGKEQVIPKKKKRAVIEKEATPPIVQSMPLPTVREGQMASFSMSSGAKKKIVTPAIASSDEGDDD